MELCLEKALLNKIKLQTEIMNTMLTSSYSAKTLIVLLAHCSVKTTEIYTHVSKKAIDKIRNPIDDFLNKLVFFVN